MVEGTKGTSLVENIVDQYNTAETVVAGWKAYWYRILVHKARRRGWWPNSSLVLACGDRTFFLYTYDDGLSHTVSICGIAFGGGL